MALSVNLPSSPVYETQFISCSWKIGLTPESVLSLFAFTRIAQEFGGWCAGMLQAGHNGSRHTCRTL